MKTGVVARISLMQPIKFSQWLEKRYIDWLHETGERRTQRQFAAWLGITPALLSHYLRGTRRPMGVFLDAIAERLGDDAYDLAEVKRPDPLLRKFKGRLEYLSQTEREQINRILDDSIRRAG